MPASSARTHDLDAGATLGRFRIRGVAERSLLPLQLRDPFLDAVRGDARFKALPGQANMPE